MIRLRRYVLEVHVQGSDGARWCHVGNCCETWHSAGSRRDQRHHQRMVERHARAVLGENPERTFPPAYRLLLVTRTGVGGATYQSEDVTPLAPEDRFRSGGGANVIPLQRDRRSSNVTPIHGGDSAS